MIQLLSQHDRVCCQLFQNQNFKLLILLNVKKKNVINFKFKSSESEQRFALLENIFHSQIYICTSKPFSTLLYLKHFLFSHNEEPFPFCTLDYQIPRILKTKSIFPPKSLYYLNFSIFKKPQTLSNSNFPFPFAKVNASLERGGHRLPLRIRDGRSR